MVLESMQQENLYRGPASSREFNERNKKMIQDVSRVYDLMNQNEQAIEENMDIVLCENFFLLNRMQQLQQEVQRLRGVAENLSESSTSREASNVHLQTFYTTDAIRNGMDSKACNLDRVHGVVTPMPTDILSRFGYTTDSGYVFLPNSLKAFVKEGNDSNLDTSGNPILEDIYDEKVKRVMDRDKNTFWIRTARFPTSQSVTEVFGEMHIQIPNEGFQNTQTNTLLIHPYPEGSMRIRDIQYRGYGDQWSRLETYPMEETTEGPQPKVIDSAGKLFFQFPKTEMTELRIFYSQPYWFEHGTDSLFTYGFQDISLEYRVYTEKLCEFVTEVDISNRNTSFVRIEEPVSYPSQGGTQDLHNLVSHELYYDADLTTAFGFGNTILSQLDKVYIKTTLRKQGDSVPVLKELRIPYKFKKNGS